MPDKIISLSFSLFCTCVFCEPQDVKKEGFSAVNARVLANNIGCSTQPIFSNYPTMDALKEDNAIWSDAYKSKVIISSPTNLFALLMIVNDLWQRDDQTKNQAAILDNALKLYRQLVDFTTALESVGTELDQARAKYDEAYKRLHTGNNNIVRLGERLRKLSAATEQKSMPKSLFSFPQYGK